ncbi:hypothetical protein BST36_23290 [Mycolicibacterium moriokaense]|uniref:Probable cytochrome c oxidase subunit 3 n=1 Tax=Mycolicibacterium moriokaense TaxID=39691 RepID=A0AAD1H7Q0_9MYCO|nr:cytochrome c oxidase subunit 3 [Mycolicibacterium moriokaense]MCV7039197.1 cytochrome c oxidase subunit 3 [Mycolicibacterium moriokaense]ORB18522.1 hypothetical protein BST36_23290 [Mycolicibacterium moriokaense]BBX00102.1 cytochrome c oxidase subunit III [Mycolicibacterium moriokaense]
MATTVATTRAKTRRNADSVPGETGIWILVLVDLMFFAAIFGVFMVERGNAPAVFDQSRAQLVVGWGAVNTLILLTSSLTMALAVRSVRQGALVQARRLVAVTAAFGVWFVVNKAIEWTAEIGAGHIPNENHFFLMYYTSAGIHLLHVLIGLVVLAYLYLAITRDIRRGAGPSPILKRNTESGGVFWHFVDLLWVVLFAVLYLAV